MNFTLLGVNSFRLSPMKADRRATSAGKSADAGRDRPIRARQAHNDLRYLVSNHP